MGWGVARLKIAPFGAVLYWGSVLVPPHPGLICSNGR